MGTYKVRIICNPDDIRKMTLPERPKSLDNLKQKVKEKCMFVEDFKIMFEDPEFNNELCNLEDIMDLPPEKATIKVIPLLTLNLLEVPSTSEMSDNTDVISNISSCSSRSEQWPDFFHIPKFPAHVEFRLHKANLLYMKDQTPLDVPSDMKIAILSKLCEEIFKYDAYPSVERLQSVALALISKHPSLREPGSQDGCSSWRDSLVFKVSNYRQKLRKSGCFEVEVNAKTTLQGMTPKGIKRPKRCEVNYLPNLPDGQTEEILEEERKELFEEMKKRNPNETVVKSKMEQTFSLRRREIVNSAPPVKRVRERWPALFTEKQVLAEFTRITTSNLDNDFFEALDRQTSQFLKLFKAKSGATGAKLSKIVRHLDSCATDITKVRTLVLQGLSVLLGEDSTNFYLPCLMEQNNDWSQVSVGILIHITDANLMDDLHLNPSSSIVLEGEVVMDGLKNLPQAVVMAFGLMYALHLDYPKAMKNTFEFIQKIMLGLGTKLPPKLQSLKNQLAY